MLVLGASGFVGRQVVAACQSRGLEVIGTSRQAPSQTGWLRVDPLDLRALQNALETVRPTAIINCVGATTGSLPELVAANGLIVANLLETVPTDARIVHLGSAAEYGPVTFGSSIAPETPANPVSAYGLTKLTGTRLLEQARADAGAGAVVLRLFNALGPGLQATTLPKSATVKLRQALEQRAPSLRFGSLEAFRDFVDVRDVAEALILAATLEALPSAVLNLGSGQATQARSLVQMLAQMASFDGEILEDGEGSPRRGEIPWQQADIGLTVSSLGWQPRWSLRDSLEWMWS